MYARLLTALAVLALAGCDASPAPSTRSSLERSAAPSPALASDERILDRRGDGATLIGRLDPVRPHSDQEPVMVLRVEPIAHPLDGARALDARFAGDAIVTVGPDHVLRAHTARGSVELDARAYGPISVAGARIAYVRGEPPFLELARADLSSGTAIGITEGMAPSWSPALTPDGRSIVFVSGVAGAPRFYRVDGEGVPRALAPTTRTPGSPIAPRFEGDLLVFDDERGTAWLDLEQGTIVRSEEVAR